MNRKTKAGVAILVALAVSAGASIPWVLQARKTARRNGCLNNLRLIDSVQCCCVPLENRLSEGDAMKPRDCFQYLKGGTCPVCPAGGQYIISYVVGGPYPTCTVHGNLLQDAQGARKLREGIRRKAETAEEYEKRIAELQKSGAGAQH